MTPRFLILIASLTLGATPAPARPPARPPVASPSDYQTVLDAANAKFDEAAALQKTDPARARELFDQSITGFRRIIDEAGFRNPALYYNIANAFLRKGDTGRAILNYRRAQTLSSADANLVANLAAARAMVVPRIATAPEGRVLRTLLFWHYDLRASTRFALFCAAFPAIWLLASLRLLSALRPGVWWAVAALALVSAATLASLIVERRQRLAARDAVIVADQVIARKGPDDSAYEPSFTEPLGAGVEVRIIERRPRWTLVRLADARESWITAQAIETVEEPPSPSRSREPAYQLPPPGG